MSAEEILTDQEIIDFHESIEANFGSTTPVQVVQKGLLKAACGWHNGSTCEAILLHHGLVTCRHNSRTELTRKGQKYLWEIFSDKVEGTV